MTTPGRGPTGAGGPAPNAFRGAALVFVAVIVGIVGLQILDDSDGATVAADGGRSPTTTTTGDGGDPAPHADPADVTLKVYNASDVQGAGQALTERLRALGYTMEEPGNIAGTRKGTVVHCREGFEGDAIVIAAFGIANGAVPGPFPVEPPDGADTADCIVILGT